MAGDWWLCDLIKPPSDSKKRRVPLAEKVGPISLCFQASRFFSGYDVIPSISSNLYNFFIWEDFSLKLARHTHIVIVKISHAERSTSSQFKILTFQIWCQFFDFQTLDLLCGQLWNRLQMALRTLTWPRIAVLTRSLWEVTLVLLGLRVNRVKVG